MKRGLIITAVAVAVVAAALLTNTLLGSRQAAAATGSPLLTVDGGLMHVREDGPAGAPALVLIHGLGGSSRWWDGVVPALARSRHVVRVDLLGHGDSAKPADADYSIPAQARRVGQVLDQLHIQHAVLVGHSTGGYVATSLAEQRPGLVDALALIDTGPRLDLFASEGFTGKLVEAPVVGQLLWRVRTEGLVRKSLSSAFAPGFTAPADIVDDVRAMTYHGLLATSHASDDYLTQRTMPERLSALGKPLLVIFGRQDQRWPVSSAELYRAVAGARIEVVADSGHSPMVEDPARTAELLSGFPPAA
ncbi:alpha/beta fold hydrolase [Hamadaea tsunoensis]|uniref:alpha/beta fold hydrolase n=1 Tax=Hamadaea tsunoensis TaxID=53368 RepID=UPI0012F89865|nr:alpha/beta fold hydrolase [Hamadaea tsunoensis]